MFHFSISSAQEIRPWWNLSSIFALIHKCLRYPMRAAAAGTIAGTSCFAFHALRKALSFHRRPFIQSVPNLLFPSFPLFCSLLHQPPPLCPICLHTVKPPQPLDPSLHGLSLPLSLQYAQIHMLSWCWITNAKAEYAQTLVKMNDCWNPKTPQSVMDVLSLLAPSRR